MYQHAFKPSGLWRLGMPEVGIDYSFTPVENETPECLTPQQIQNYNELGYLRPFDIYAAPEIAEIRKYFDGLITAKGDDGAFGVNCFQARLSGIWDIATEPRILDLVEDIVGPDIVCWATAVLSKPANTSNFVPWHQDASFWSLSPARTVTVWLAIDDADEENAAMQWIPRTHDKGHFEVEKSGTGAVFHFQTAGANQMGTPVSDSLEAGQCSLHADMIIHGSPPNLSNRRRCGLTMRYCSPAVRIVDQSWSAGVEAIVCRGEDRSGHWKHHTRPHNDDITKCSSPRAYGNN